MLDNLSRRDRERYRAIARKRAFVHSPAAAPSSSVASDVLRIFCSGRHVYASRSYETRTSHSASRQTGISPAEPTRTPSPSIKTAQSEASRRLLL
jgi:hypothetical protein